MELPVYDEFVGIHAINPFIRECSASRAHMFSTHLSQALVFENAEPSILVTGLERQLGQNGFDIKTDTNCRVLKIIDRYKTLESDGVERLIMVMKDNGELDYITTPIYNKLSPDFGFIYQKQNILNNLKTDTKLPKDTILATSPNIKHNNGVCSTYSYGINANLCMANLLETSEDGVIISKSLADKLSYYIVETKTIEFGNTHYPLNLYGDKDNYKIIPEIGEYIRDDAVVLGIREYDNIYSSLEDTMKYNIAFDTVKYAKQPKGKVIDIRVYTNRNLENNENILSKSIDKYVYMLKSFYNDILNSYYEILERYNLKECDMKTTRRFRNLIIKAMGITRNKANIKYKNQLIDMYRIELDILHKIEIKHGHKITDKSGSKGVIVNIRDDDMMPYIITKHGNKVRADIVMDPSAVISRMNISRLYEQYFCGMSRKTKELIQHAKSTKEAFNILLGLLKLIDNDQYKIYKNATEQQQEEIIKECLEKEVYIYYRVSDKKRPYQIVLDSKGTIYEPDRVPLYIPDGNGNDIQTKEHFIIAPVYTLLLSKTPDTFLSVASARVNHFGFPIGVSSSLKDNLPYRNSPTKVLSETEVRLYRAYVSDKAIVELKDRANNNNTHEEVYMNILDANLPTNIEHVVDRSNGYGESVAMKLTNSIFNTFGIKIVRSNDDL